VAFHAVHLPVLYTFSYGSPIVFRDIRYNEGGCYSSTTGYFTTPADGLYYFIASSGPNPQNSGAFFYLNVDDTEIDQAYAYHGGLGGEMSSVHAVLHARTGQRVWVKSEGNQYLNSVSSFTGFLLSRDF
jgi:hypothetical protein